MQRYSSQARLLQAVDLTPVKSTRMAGGIAGESLWLSTIHGAISSTLCGANNECAAGGLDHILCNDTQFVDTQDTLNLNEQSV